eukprot:Lithocolla_globosa_v1_NODE_1096_length_2874_cov_39.982263.p2 type:complete len:117 gc:universal NODE_1096_length_2874_cov_39.982263:2544-2194(-)
MNLNTVVLGMLTHIYEEETSPAMDFFFGLCDIRIARCRNLDDVIFKLGSSFDIIKRQAYPDLIPPGTEISTIRAHDWSLPINARIHFAKKGSTMSKSTGYDRSKFPGLFCSAFIFF